MNSIKESNNQSKIDNDPNHDDDGTIPIISNPIELQKYGVIQIPIPKQFDISKWASEYSHATPLNFTSEADNEYAFYRNILDEPSFPFDSILDLNSETSIGQAISTYFLNSKNGTEDEKKEDNDLMNQIRLDDAFCIHYNTNQSDTTCAKHMDPSDITVNLCLEKSDDVIGSEVLFYGTQSLANKKNHKIAMETNDFRFLVPQKQGIATLHYGCHPHETMPLKQGKRTNIVLTYCYTDESKSGVALRTCYL